MLLLLLSSRFVRSSFGFAFLLLWCGWPRGGVAGRATRKWREDEEAGAEGSIEALWQEGGRRRHFPI